jgi:hypothetical protein
MPQRRHTASRCGASLVTLLSVSYDMSGQLDSCVTLGQHLWLTALILRAYPGPQCMGAAMVDDKLIARETGHHACQRQQQVETCAQVVGRG